MKIDRKLEDGGWVYADPELHEVVLVWNFLYGFNLVTFDDWIQAPKTRPSLGRQLMTLRQRAIDAHLAGNSDAAEGWVMYLRELQTRRRYEQVLSPGFGRDLAMQVGRSAGGKAKTPKLPPADELRAEVEALCAKRGFTEAEAKGVVRQRYGATAQAVNRKMKKT